MNKILLFALIILNSSLSFGRDNDLENARKKINQFSSISYNVTAFYPNPETEELTTFKMFQIINNLKNNSFDFYCKADNYEELYVNDIYKELRNNEKTIYEYEKKQNQINFLKNSRVVQYGPTFLINYDWKYEDEVLIDNTKQSHYSYIENSSKYEGKTIKVVFHIYISSNHTISKFERKSYVDDKLGQTVTYNFFDYNFFKKKRDLKNYIPKDYALKYFEKSEVHPLKNKTKAPSFLAVDLNNNTLSEKIFTGNKTILLFSSTNCGASKSVSDYLYDKSFQLPSNYNLINVFASDSKNNIEKYLKESIGKFSIVVNQKKIENTYQISGFPTAYFIDENGVISKTFDGYNEIINFLKSLE